MQSLKNILFIINPISGGKEKKTIPEDIERYLDHNKLVPTIKYTEYVGHAKELALNAVQNNFDIIVASGGDGTINEIATIVMKYQKTLAILPLGSGNGLARFLNIPLNIKDAIDVINKLNIINIDTATLNGKSFFNMAGVGFDAYLSLLFSSNKGRGITGYIADGIKSIYRYKAKQYKLIIDGEVQDRSAFAISVANSSQYGNNVYIAPTASVTDGLLDVCIIKPYPLIKLPYLIYIMIQKKLIKNNMIDIIKAKSVKIIRATEDPVHIDGEPLMMGKEIEININHLSLSVIVG